MIPRMVDLPMGEYDSLTEVDHGSTCLYLWLLVYFIEDGWVWLITIQYGWLEFFNVMLCRNIFFCVTLPQSKSVVACYWKICHIMRKLCFIVVKNCWGWFTMVNSNWLWLNMWVFLLLCCCWIVPVIKLVGCLVLGIIEYGWFLCELWIGGF